MDDKRDNVAGFLTESCELGQSDALRLTENPLWCYQYSGKVITARVYRSADRDASGVRPWMANIYVYGDLTDMLCNAQLLILLEDIKGMDVVDGVGASQRKGVP